jgi:hypothetical protein
LVDKPVDKGSLEYIIENGRIKNGSSRNMMEGAWTGLF